MKIEMLYFEGCPTYREAEALIEEVIRSEGTPAEIESVQVKTEEEAIQLGFLGSPTIRIDGVDIDPVARSSTDFGLKCRVYRDGKRFVGLPPREMLRRAIKQARNGKDCCASHG
jgi:hypothetical protein